jgi:cell division protein FtsL
VSPPNSNSTLESPTPATPRSNRKPQADVYTILLALALVAVLVAILFLYLWMKSYDFKADAPAVTMLSRQISLFASCLFSGP